MRSLVFEGSTWEAYEKMRDKDKKLHNALCKLLKEMLRSDDPSTGIGKPEPLKHNLSGLWSRRISQKDSSYTGSTTDPFIFSPLEGTTTSPNEAVEKP
ncbi:type II toxin-antitoxin system YoeB family toxin [Marinobacter sp. AC-23]|uniref:type II toxin-antitoxin system YoeB family toxin n=1 Tax=Marinobacter sp. AC-23 TaxID=1879031 RepID=UPI000A56E555|nr:type II toxin-antitoxin system YoeB family toxin [Marinobacter sp. AC-23]